MRSGERCAFTARRHSNFSVAINKDFSITTRSSVIADTSALAAISGPGEISVPLQRTLTTTELLLCNVINVERGLKQDALESMRKRRERD